MSDTPTRQLTDRQLKWSYWLITHKLGLRRYFIGFLIAAGAALFFYVGWQLVFFVIEYPQFDFQVRKMIYGQNEAIVAIQSLRPQPLNISNTQILGGEGGENSYDFLAQINNPNSDWLATFDYRLKSDTNRPFKSAFILPKENKYLLDAGGASGGDLEIANLRWERTRDFPRLLNERFRFKVENEEFIAGQVAGDPNRVVFDLTNESAFSYWEVGVFAILTGGGNIEAANRVVLEQFKAGEKRSVQINWAKRLPRIDGVEIIPEVNFLDSKNIMPPQGGAGEYR